MAGFSSILQLGLGLAQIGIQQKAAKKQEQAARLQQQAQARNALRQAQVQRARMVAVGQTLGAATTNTLGAQFGATAGLATQLSGLNADITRLNAQASALGLFGDMIGSIDFSAFKTTAPAGGG
jgi:dienelactone hydrolase